MQKSKLREKLVCIGKTWRAFNAILHFSNVVVLVFMNLLFQSQSSPICSSQNRIDQIQTPQSLFALYNGSKIFIQIHLFNTSFTLPAFYCKFPFCFCLVIGLLISEFDVWILKLWSRLLMEPLQCFFSTTHLTVTSVLLPPMLLLRYFDFFTIWVFLQLWDFLFCCDWLR